MAKRGYLVPTVIDPPTRRCVTFYVPDDQLWWAAFWGQMTDLANTWLWEGTPTQKAEITAIWNGVLQTARQNWLDGECTLPLEFRVVNDRVEYRPDPYAAWTDIGVSCGCPPVLASPQNNPDGGTFDQRACNIAVNLIIWIMEKYNDSIDAFEAAADTVAAFDATWLLFPPGYLIADQILDMINEFVEVGANAARAFDSETHREEMQHFLYCEMRSGGELTADIWENFLEWAHDEYANILNPGYSAWDFYTEGLDVNAVLARSRIVSYETADCIEFNCDYDWEHIFDFAAEESLLGWYTNPGTNLPTVEASGLRASLSVVSGNARRGFFMRKQLTYADSTTRILTMRADVEEVNEGDTNVSPARVNATRTITSADVIIDNPASQPLTPMPSGAWSLDFNPSQAYSNTNIIRWFMQVAQKNFSSTVTGNGLLTKITIRGNGKNPFVV